MEIDFSSLRSGKSAIFSTLRWPAWRFGRGEVVRLFKRSWREGYHSLAAVIAIMWSSQQSPGDVRTLVASQLVTDGAGAVFFTDRAKRPASRSAARLATAPWRRSKLT